MGLRLGHHVPFWIVWSLLNKVNFAEKEVLKQAKRLTYCHVNY